MALFPLPLSPPRERAPSIPAATEGGGHVARPTPPRCKRCAPARDRYRNVTAKGTHAASATSYALRRGITVVAVRGVLTVVDHPLFHFPRHASFLMRLPVLVCLLLRTGFHPAFTAMTMPPMKASNGRASLKTVASIPKPKLGEPSSTA